MNAILVSIGSALRVATRSLHRVSARLASRHIDHVGSKSGWVEALRDTRLISDRNVWAKSAAARRPAPPG